MTLLSVVAVLVLGSGHSTHNAVPPAKHASVTIRLDEASFATTPLPHTWKRSFGSGHAALGLRSDWLAQLKQARDDLGLQGVRQHGLFDDDMGQ